MRLRYSVFSVVLSILVLCIPALRAQDGLRGALSRNGERAHLGSVLAVDLVSADFDNDDKPDGAILLEAGQMNGETAFRIEFHLTARQNSTVNFSSAEIGLTISALDVNRDGAPDIVVEKVFTHKRLKVFLNDGHGSFQNASPEAFLAPDESAPQFRVWTNVQDQATLFIPVTRAFDLVEAVPVPRDHDAVQKRFWSEALVAECGARAPSQSRAPPSRLSV